MIVQADSRRLPLAGGSVQCCVTSPPYWGLRDYAIAGQLGLELTPEEYVANMVAVFQEVKRVLRNDGTLWLNLGDSYYGGGNYRGNSDLSEKQASNGGAQGIRIGKPVTCLPHEVLKPKDLVGIPWRVAFALQADGWYLRSDIIWAKKNCMPESVTDRPTKSHEYLFLLAKSERYFYNADAISEPAIYDAPNSPQSIVSPYGQGFTRRAKDYKNGAGISDQEDNHQSGGFPGYGNRRNARSVWTIATQPYSGAHFATFPEKLVEPCILAGSRPGDLVLDPFAGSGTVMRVATRFQRKAVGCDLNPKYLVEQAKKRTSNVQIQFCYALS